MKYFFSLFLSLVLCQASFAQSIPMAVYAETGGPGLFSINLDSRLTASETGLGARIGFGGLIIESSGFYTVPLGINYLIGKDDKNYFELGAGYTIMKVGEFGYDSESFSFRNATIGYRYAPKDGGFFFKAQLMPMIRRNFFLPIGGLGFGYKF